MRSILILAIVFLPIATPTRVFAQCAREWANPFITPLGKPIADSGVNFDPDGDGPLPDIAVFAGRFVLADGSSHDGVAGWDGTEWTPLGPAFTLATGESIFASVAIDDDGSGPHPPTLWMGGNFSSFAGVATHGIARYAQGVWSGSGADTVNVVSQMISLDEDGPGPQFPRLCVQASFPVAGECVAILDGGEWEIFSGGPMSGGITGLVAIDLDGPGPLLTRPVVVGEFSNYAGSDVQHVAVWTGEAWESVGDGTDGVIRSVAVHDPDGNGPQSTELIVAGQFQHAGNVASNGVARFRNGAWEAIANPLDSSGAGSKFMTCVLSADDDGSGPRLPQLFIAGTNSGSGIPTLFRVFRGDGYSPWEDIGLGAAPISGLTSKVVNLVWQGRFAPHVFMDDFMWNGRSWSRLTPKHSMIAEMQSIDLDGPGPVGYTLVVAGKELGVSNPYTSDCIAQWDGLGWRALGARTMLGTVNAVAQYDADGDGPLPPRLLAAGRMKIGSATCAVAILEGQAWEVFGNSLFTSNNTASVADMRVIDVDGPGELPPYVVISGILNSFGGQTFVNSPQKWDGHAWSYAGAASGGIALMHVHDPDGPGPALPSLFAATNSTSGPIPTNGIVRWNGVTWNSVPDSVTGELPFSGMYQCLCSFDIGNGVFALCGGRKYSQTVAVQWSNGEWAPVGGATTYQAISSIASHDDGLSNGLRPSLYVSGLITGLPDNPGTQRIARWDGNQWRSLGIGLSSGARQMASVDFDGSNGDPAELFLSGGFTRAGGNPVDNLAVWRIASPRFSASPWSRIVVAGSRVSLKLVATGQTPLVYQWRKDGQDISDGGGVSGSTTRELVIDSSHVSDIGDYDCVVTNDCGSKSCAPAHLHVCAALPGPDVNHDGGINGLDIPPFVAAWSSNASDGVCSVDLNANGAMDPEDLQWFMEWLLAP